MRAYIEFLGAVTVGGRMELDKDDLRAIGEFTRENVSAWFEGYTSPDWVGVPPVEDFHAVYGDIDIPWATEEARRLWVTHHSVSPFCELCKNVPPREGSHYCIMCEERMWGFRY